MRIRRSIAVGLAGLTAAATLAMGTGTAGAVEGPATCGKSAISQRGYTITHTDGTSFTTSYLSNSAPMDLRPGDTIAARIAVAADCVVEVGLASYQAPNPTLNPNDVQNLFDFEGGFYASGIHVLTVTLPSTAGDGTTGCPNKHQDGPETKGKGANTSGAYDSTCDGSPSQNGVGDGKANGKPCAGCVGNADDKNPPGQAPDGSDPNAGYECDRNQGVGKSNPAHSGCKKPIFFQVDLFEGPVLQQVNPATGQVYGSRLIAAYNGPK